MNTAPSEQNQHIFGRISAGPAGISSVKIGATDNFERLYMAQFREIAAQYGVFVEYEMDRAGRDLGLHLTQRTNSTGGQIVTPALIWFQMKGLMPDTLSKEDFDKSTHVTISLDTMHLRFWYMNLQPTYLALFIGSVEKFLVIDLKKWVTREYGDAILTHKAKTVSVKVSKDNVLNVHFFRAALSRNLVPVIRERFANDDRAAARFLRDSSLVKQIAECEKRGKLAKIVVIDWHTKMRTEVHFLVQDESGDWQQIRNHWEIALEEMHKSFPYLSFAPKREAQEVHRVEYDEDWDGNEIARHFKSYEIVEKDDDGFFDDEDFDGACILDIGNSILSYGEMAGGEYVEHEISVQLNEIGRNWAQTLEVLENAEIISVDTTPHFLSVAPWNPGYA